MNCDSSQCLNCGISHSQQQKEKKLHDHHKLMTVYEYSQDVKSLHIQ